MNNLRPDEKQSLMDIERSRNTDRNIKSGLKTAGSIAATATGLGVASRILPLINQYVPTEMAIKGISKLSPQIGGLLKKGMEQGLDIKDGLNFIKDQFEKKEKPKENRNIIQQYSPELHQFIDQEIKKGRKPIEAAAIAQNDKRFSKIIDKLSKDHKTNWSDIIQGIYGNGEMGQSTAALHEQQPEQVQQTQQTQQPQGQPGQGQQALMAVLQKINQRLGQ